MDVDILGGVDSVGVGRTRNQVQLRKGSKVEKVKGRPQVDIEAFPALAGEDGLAGRKVVDRGRSQVGVGRRRTDADVAGRAGQVAGELRLVVALDPGDGVELAPIPGG